MTTYRKQVTLFNYSATTTATQVVDTAYPGRRLARLGPPYVLSWKATVAGSGLEASPNFEGEIQDSADGSTYSAVSALTVTAITATTSAAPTTKQKTYASQLRQYVRFIAKTIEAGTWGSGVTLTAILTGEQG